MPLTCAEYATDFACSNARFSASTVLMSGFGAPRRTAMPMLERARSTRLAATTLPSPTNSSIAGATQDDDVHRFTASHAARDGIRPDSC